MTTVSQKNQELFKAVRLLNGIITSNMSLDSYLNVFFILSVKLKHKATKSESRKGAERLSFKVLMSKKRGNSDLESSIVSEMLCSEC